MGEFYAQAHYGVLQHLHQPARPTLTGRRPGPGYRRGSSGCDTASARRHTQGFLRTAKARKATRGLALDQGAQALMDERGAIHRPGQLRGALEQGVVESDGHTHGGLSEFGSASILASVDTDRDGSRLVESRRPACLLAKGNEDRDRNGEDAR